MIRVLVAEDSPTARALLVAILGSDPEITVVGEACNGSEAVEMTRRLRPDVVTMDVRMPVLDGLEATKEIMITAPTPIVIVTASFLARDVEISLHALRAGALTVLAKPPGPEAASFDEACRQLIAGVKAMSQVKVVRHWRPTTSVPIRHPPLVRGRGKLVAVAASTGGPAALHRLLTDLPGDFPAPILVTQHISPGFIAGLADWLNRNSDLRVKLAEAGEPLAPHIVYLAPDDRHLGISEQAIVLSTAPPIGGFRPSGTFLFESAARAYGASVVVVILTGMGDDGVAGLRAVRAADGCVIAQDEQSCVVFGMPGAAVAAGAADLVLPLDAIAARLRELVS